MSITIWVSMGCAAVAGFLWPRGLPAAARRLGDLLPAQERRGGDQISGSGHFGEVVPAVGTGDGVMAAPEAQAEATGHDLPRALFTDANRDRPGRAHPNGFRWPADRVSAREPEGRGVDKTACEYLGGSLRSSRRSADGGDMTPPEAKALVDNGGHLTTADLLGWKKSDPSATEPRHGPAPAERTGMQNQHIRLWGAAALAGTVVALLLGGFLGVAGGIAATVGTATAFGRLESREQRERRMRMVADLPVTVDLLAACLRGGASWGEAVESVAGAIGGPLGDELRGVAARVRLGADPATAWLALAESPELAPLARIAARTVDSGAALAPALARLAGDRRRAARAAATSRARAAGIRAVAPLGLCFLPAFVLLGVLPAVAGIAQTLLHPF